MDKKMKRISISLCLLLAGAFVGLGASALRTEQASAEVSTDIVMVKGASIRLSTETGVKFAYGIENYSESVQYGMLIVPYDYLAKANVSIANDTDYVVALTTAYENGVIPYAPAVGTELEVKTDANGNQYAEYSVTGIFENNYDRKWFGIGFVDNGEKYVYAQYNDNVRDVVSVASATLNDYHYNAELEDEYKTLYATYNTELNNFVTKGVANVTQEMTYEVSGATSALVEDELSYTLDVAEGVSLQSVWASSNEEVATIDENGKVTCLTAGETTITAKSAGLYTSSVTLTVCDNQGDLFEMEILDVATHAEAYSVEKETDTVKDSNVALKYTSTQNAKLEFMSLQDISKVSTINANEVDFSKDVYVGFWLKTDTNMNINVRMKTYNGTEWSNTSWVPHYWCYAEPKANSEWQYVEINVTEGYKETSPVSSGYYLHTENVTNWGIGLFTWNDACTFYFDGLSIYNKETEELVYANSAHATAYSVEKVTDTVKDGNVALQYTYDGTANVNRASFMQITDGSKITTIGDIDWSKEVYVGFWIKATEKNVGIAARMQNTQDGSTWKGHGGGYHYWCHAELKANAEWQYVEIAIMAVHAEKDFALYTENVTNWKLCLTTEIGDGACTFYFDGLSIYNKETEELVYSNSTRDSHYSAEIVNDEVKEGNVSLKYTYAYDETVTDRRKIFAQIGNGSAINTIDMSTIDWSQEVYVGFWVKTDQRLTMAVRMQNTQGGSTWQGYGGGFSSYWCHLDVAAKAEWQYVEIAIMETHGTKGYALYTESVTNWKLNLCADSLAEGYFYFDGLSIYNK